VAQQICHLDRSAAEWRDLWFLSVLTHSIKPSPQEQCGTPEAEAVPFVESLSSALKS